MKKTIQKFQKTSLIISGYMLILVIWIVIAIYNRNITGKPFPYPWEAAAALFEPGVNKINLFQHAGVSFIRWTAGFSIAAIVGIIIGILTGLKPGLNLLLSPLITSLQLIPGLAWVPIVLILFGLGNFSTIFMIAMTAVVPVIINTRAGIVQIEPVLLKVSKMLELNRRQQFFKIILPGAAPDIVSGLRIGTANGFRVLISAEMIVGSGLGLGYSLFQARWSLDYDSAFGSLILIVLIGLILDKVLFQPIERNVNRKRGLI